ncbi:MAG: hypothetical protein O2856_06720 [Planctomycetota bacterium]|nr:hypothetical protein [Planctomycetota bacterium]
MSTNDSFETNVHNPSAFEETGPPAGSQRGFVHHVMALSILMIIHAAIEVLIGLGSATAAIVVPMMIRAEEAGRQGRRVNAPPMPQGLEWMLMAVYGGIGILFVLIGVIGIWAGIRMMKFRSRTMGIVALSSGLVALFGCYCIPTAIGLFIYGLIVLLNPQVRQAFDMGEQGYSTAEIQDHFSRLPG